MWIEDLWIEVTGPQNRQPTTVKNRHGDRQAAHFFEHQKQGLEAAVVHTSLWSRGVKLIMYPQEMVKEIAACQKHTPISDGLLCQLLFIYCHSFMSDPSRRIFVPDHFWVLIAKAKKHPRQKSFFVSPSVTPISSPSRFRRPLPFARQLLYKPPNLARATDADGRHQCSATKRRIFQVGVIRVLLHEFLQRDVNAPAELTVPVHQDFPALNEWVPIESSIWTHASAKTKRRVHQTT